MKKSILILSLLLVLVLTVLVACHNDDTTASETTHNPAIDAPATAEEVRILALKGPTGMGLANVINDAKLDESSRYSCEIMAGPDLVKTEVLLGNYDIAALPTNVAAALYNTKKADFVIAAVNTLGVRCFPTKKKNLSRKLAESSVKNLLPPNTQGLLTL